MTRGWSLEGPSPCKDEDLPICTPPSSGSGGAPRLSFRLMTHPAGAALTFTSMENQESEYLLLNYCLVSDSLRCSVMIVLVNSMELVTNLKQWSRLKKTTSGEISCGWFWFPMGSLLIPHCHFGLKDHLQNYVSFIQISVHDFVHMISYEQFSLCELTLHCSLM